MNRMFLTVLSMSVSGALLILGLLFISWLLRTKCSRRWQYYIWLLVIARLLLPFGPEISLMGRVSEAVNRAAAADGAVSEQRVWQNSYADFSEIGEAGAADSVQKTNNYCFGLIWFTIALGMLARKIVKYQSFIRHVKTGAEPVSDQVLLNRLFEAQWRAGIRKKTELFVNPMVSSPMLIGFWRPCIVLPGTDMSEKDFRYVVTHELMHEKRKDILYKWLVQFTVCLHWLNPLVYVMSREISKACELSCDEAVLEKLGYEHAADYGKTLLDAMAAVGKYKEPFAGVSLSANKRILKERLGAIMNDKEKSGKMRILMAGLTACMALGVFFVGIYPADRAEASEKPAVEIYQAGTVNVKILRGEDLDKEKTDEEVRKEFPRTMVVKNRVCKIREGAGVEYSVVGLAAEGEKLTVLGSEEGSNGQLWYRLDRESFGEKLDDSVKTCYIRADLLWEESDEAGD